jgi:hypothetical protein
MSILPIWNRAAPPRRDGREARAMGEQRAWFRFGLAPEVTVDVVFSAPPSADDLNGFLEMLDAQIRVLKRATGRPSPTAATGGEGLG